MTWSVRRLSESEFSGMASEWHSCLGRANADPLFMSWPWVYSWWQTWSQILGLELLLFGVYDQNEELQGIGPFCRRVLTTPMGLRVSRLFIIGNAWRLAPTVRTEYCGLICPRDHEAEVRALLAGALSECEWDELICSDAPASTVNTCWQPLCDANGLRLIERAEDTGIRVRTAGSFAEWLKTLGKNTRLKVFNRRAYLAGEGTLEFGRFDSSSGDDFFLQLNRFHQDRWKKPAFDREAERFHRLLVSRMDECGGRAEQTSLSFNGECVSALYDLVVGGCRYNLQAGYKEDLDPKVSLGYLHLGFAIESAFEDPDVDGYDLLAGNGKTQFYKAHFKGEQMDFVTLQVVRSSMLKAMYNVQENSPPKLARVFNRRIGL